LSNTKFAAAKSPQTFLRALVWLSDGFQRGTLSNNEEYESNHEPSRDTLYCGSIVFSFG
jgi:hypothetical protein